MIRAVLSEQFAQSGDLASAFFVGERQHGLGSDVARRKTGSTGRDDQCRALGFEQAQQFESERLRVVRENA